MVGPVTRPKRGRPTAVYKEYEYFCPYTTSRKLSPAEEMDRALYDEPQKAYKLGKQRWSYNQCELTMTVPGFGEISVAEATQQPGDLENGVQYQLALEHTRTKLRARVYVVYDDPQAVQEGQPDGSTRLIYRWPEVRRVHCNKHTRDGGGKPKVPCQGPLLRPIQRFGKQGKRSGAPVGSPEKVKDPRYMYLSIDEACTHVRVKVFRLLVAITDESDNRILGTTLSRRIKVLANNDVPTGSAFINLELELDPTWQEWDTMSTAPLDNRAGQGSRFESLDYYGGPHSGRFQRASSLSEQEAYHQGDYSRHAHIGTHLGGYGTSLLPDLPEALGGPPAVPWHPLDGMMHGSEAGRPRFSGVKMEQGTGAPFGPGPSLSDIVGTVGSVRLGNSHEVPHSTSLLAGSRLLRRDDGNKQGPLDDVSLFERHERTVQNFHQQDPDKMAQLDIHPLERIQPNSFLPSFNNSQEHNMPMRGRSPGPTGYEEHALLLAGAREMAEDGAPEEDLLFGAMLDTLPAMEEDIGGVNLLVSHHSGGHSSSADLALGNRHSAERTYDLL